MLFFGRGVKMPTKKGALRDLVELQSRLNSIISEVMEPTIKSEAEDASLWVPSADVTEDENNYYIEMEVPGVELNNIEILSENNSVRVKGERKISREIVPENVYRMERFFGLFFREFSFGSQIDRDKIEASLENGVLTIILPKKNEKKKIPIR